MNLLRTLWYLATLAFTTAFWSAACVVGSFVGVRWRKGGLYDLAARKWGTWLCSANGLTVRVEGLDRLPLDRPYVFIANHFSFCDIWALLVVLPDSVRFVSKKELFDIPLFGHALRAARHISIDRKNLQAAFGAYEEAGVVIRDGISAIVFAEGTRSADGKLHPFKKGPFVLAIAAQVEVIPVWIEGAFEALPKDQWYVKPGTVTLRFGDPVPAKGLDYEGRDDLSDRVREQIIALAGDHPGVRVDRVGASG
jgi:1-acyl-sn-glycerol-3-phosphate acyltransferase